MKIVRIRSFSGPHFPTFGLNTEQSCVFLRIQSTCGKIQTRRTPNTDIFHAVEIKIFFKTLAKPIGYNPIKVEVCIISEILEKFFCLNFLFLRKYLYYLTFLCLVLTKRSHILKTNLQLSAAGLFKYVWSFNRHQALKG